MPPMGSFTCLSTVPSQQLCAPEGPCAAPRMGVVSLHPASPLSGVHSPSWGCWPPYDAGPSRPFSGLHLQTCIQGHTSENLLCPRQKGEAGPMSYPSLPASHVRWQAGGAPGSGGADPSPPCAAWVSAQFLGAGGTRPAAWVPCSLHCCWHEGSQSGSGPPKPVSRCCSTCMLTCTLFTLSNGFQHLYHISWILRCALPTFSVSLN